MAYSYSEVDHPIMVAGHFLNPVFLYTLYSLLTCVCDKESAVTGVAVHA